MHAGEVPCVLLICFALQQTACAEGTDGMIGARQATQFFNEHPNPVDFEQQGDRLLLANRVVGLEFCQSDHGFRLLRIYGIKDGQDFLAAGQADADIFKIVTCLDPARVYQHKPGRNIISPYATRAGAWYEIMDQMAGEERHQISSLSASATSFGRTGDDSETTLHLEWKQIELPQDREKAKMDVEVTITIKADDPLSYWRFRVKNPSTWVGIYKVQFPELNLAPIQEAADNVFIWPDGRGAMADDPFKKLPGVIEGLYPDHIGMQFMALYNKRTGIGMYLGTFDPTPNLMEIRVERDSSGIWWRPSHFPPNITFANEDFSLPYDCVVGPFRGDWYDACQIYRKWAVKQSWCSKGPLAMRQDIPKWFKEAPLHLTADAGARDDSLAGIRDHYLKFLKWTGVPLPCALYAWKSYKPDLTIYQAPYCYYRRGLGRSGIVENIHDGNYPKLPALPSLGETCRLLKEAGGMMAPYVCLQIYDQGPYENAPYAQEARHHVSRDLFANILGAGWETSWRPCVWSQWWKDRLKETCITMMQKEHVMGFYLDTMSGCAVPCYWTPHGHTAGGGSMATAGMHQLSGYIRDAVKAVNPEAVTFGENSGENMIDVIDGKLYPDTLTPQSGPPLFAAVYKDYITRHGIQVNAHEGDRFFMESAVLFAEGAQIGRLYLNAGSRSLYPDDPKQRQMVDFLGRMVGYYKQDVTKKFLCYGQLMRPLHFRQPDPMPMVSYEYWRGKVELPAILSGVFLSAGELGVFVLNVSDQEISFVSDLDLSRYDLSADTAYEVEMVTPEGMVSLYRDQAKGKVILEGNMPGRYLRMFRVRSARR